MKKFSMTHMLDDTTGNPPTEFTETNAPDWLTSETTVPGSTMDMRWFWKDYVLTLEVGKSIDTDFRTITRIA